MNRNGFTLLEVLIVAALIGILASLALPAYLNVTEKGRVAEAKNMLGAIRLAQIGYAGQNAYFTTNVSTLDATLPSISGTVSQGRFFNYTAVSGGAATDSTAIVGRAVRNSNQNSYSNYVIQIRKNGTFEPDATAASFM